MRIARTVPELAVTEIHRWRTWPDRLHRTGLDGRDIGVDLSVARTIAGLNGSSAITEAPETEAQEQMDGP